MPCRSSHLYTIENLAIVHQWHFQIEITSAEPAKMTNTPTVLVCQYVVPIPAWYLPLVGIKIINHVHWGRSLPSVRQSKRQSSTTVHLSSTTLTLRVPEVCDRPWSRCPAESWHPADRGILAADPRQVSSVDQFQHLSQLPWCGVHLAPFSVGAPAVPNEI